MKKLMLFLIAVFFILSVPINAMAVSYSSNKSYYKGSDPGYGYGTYREDTTKYDTSIEYGTVSVYQYYNSSLARGEAHVRGYARMEAIEREFGADYAYYGLDSVRVGLLDADDRKYLRIYGQSPSEAMNSSATEVVSWAAGALPWYASSFVTMAANGLTTGVRHGDNGTYRWKWIETYGWGIQESKLSADSSYSYRDVEKWAHNSGSSKGLAGYFAYDLVNRPSGPYYLRGYTQSVYTVDPKSYSGLTYKYYGSVATNLHLINDY